MVSLNDSSTLKVLWEIRRVLLGTTYGYKIKGQLREHISSEVV